jgi:predicted nucleic acid-binding protein
MPIRPFLADQAFEPEVITSMSLALERVCDALRLDDVATRLVAEKIIALAQRGIRDADTLASMVLKDLQPDMSPT